MIAMLVTAFYNMADTYFVSQLGTSASAACGVLFGLQSLIQAIGFMCGHGAGSFISRSLGAHHQEAADQYASTSFLLSTSLGLLFGLGGILFLAPLVRLLGATTTIAPYAQTYGFWVLLASPALTLSCVTNNILRYEGKAFYAMIGLVSGSVLNIFGDALLTPYFGIAGAGFSTFFSQWISLALLAWPFFYQRTHSHFYLRQARISLMTSILAVGLPSLTRQGLNAASTILLNLLASPYSDAAIAGVSIANKVMMLLFCLAIGLGQGFQPICAYNYGAGNHQRVKQGLYWTIGMGMVMMLVFALVSGTFAKEWIALFRNESQVIGYGSLVLKHQLLVLTLMPITLYVNMAYQAMGKAKPATFLAALRSGILFIPLALVLTHWFGFVGLSWTQAVSDGLSCLFALPFLLMV